MDEFESRIKDAFKELAGLKTPACLDTTSIGLFAEEKLSGKEKEKAEEHIKSCLYCLNQLTEMKELLLFKSQKTPVPQELTDKLIALHLHQERKSLPSKTGSSLLQKIWGLLAYPVQQWRYSIVSLASVCITILISLAIFSQKKYSPVSPLVDLNSFVKVRALGSDGKILSEAQGVVVSDKGLVASNLYQMGGASSIQVTSRDGTTYATRNIWKDEDKNLAVMKIDNLRLPVLPLVDIEKISVGEHAFMLLDPSRPKQGFKEAVVSDFKTYPGRHKGEELQYIQVASVTSSLTQGALVDKDGRLIGLIATKEKNINLAVPLQNIKKMVKEHTAMPVSELKNVKFSAEALNLYMQGILARDAQKWDEAMEHFKKATELNPNLGGAHLELGYVYYKKRLYDLEAKEYQEALRINPENTDAIFSLAENLVTRNLYEQAIKEYERGLALDSQDAEALYELGIAYLAIGQKTKALDIYPKLKVLDPGNAEVLNRLMRYPALSR